MPPASPTPGCSTGDVCRLSMATRRRGNARRLDRRRRLATGGSVGASVVLLDTGFLLFVVPVRLTTTYVNCPNVRELLASVAGLHPAAQRANATDHSRRPFGN